MSVEQEHDIALMVEHIEGDLAERDLNWSNHVETLIGIHGPDERDPFDIYGHKLEKLRSILPALKQAERTGQGLQEQKIAVVEVLINE